MKCTCLAMNAQVVLLTLKMLQKLTFDSAPTDQEAADAFTTCIRWLEHHGYPDVNFVCKMSELRDYAAHHM